jgi:ribosomal-protein-alanine N-acetyltransferase
MADIGLVLEIATEADLEEVMEIEAASFRAPWPIENFRNELENQLSRFVTVRVNGGTMAGFAIYWIAAEEVHLINLAVHPGWRRNGIARTLLDRIYSDGTSELCRILALEVRKSNSAAISLYKSIGCVAVGIRSGYYSDNNEDALVMVCELGASVPEARPVDGM